MLQNGTHWGQIVPRRISFVNTICWPYQETHLVFTKLRRCGTIWPQCVPVYEQLFIANTFKVVQNGTHWGQIVPRRISFVNRICLPYKETHLVFTKLRRRGTIWPQCVPVYEQLFIANTYKVSQNGTHWGQVVPRLISFVNTKCWPYKETQLVFTKLMRLSKIHCRYCNLTFNSDEELKTHLKKRTP